MTVPTKIEILIQEVNTAIETIIVQYQQGIVSPLEAISAIISRIQEAEISLREVPTHRDFSDYEKLFLVRTALSKIEKLHAGIQIGSIADMLIYPPKQEYGEDHV